MTPVVREPTPEEDRVRPGPLVGVAVASLAAGFLVVYALGQSAAEAPPADREAPRRAHTDEAHGAAPAPAKSAAASPEPSPQAAAPLPEAPPSPEPSAPAEPLPEAAPAAAPPPAAASVGGATQGEAFYFRCWEAGHDDPVEGSCDALPVFEQRIREQLGEIVACASGSQGTLSIGAEVQFGSKRTRWWSGRSTTITPVEPLIQCVRARLADTNVEGIEHRYQKYTLFVPIELGPSR